MPNLAGIHDPTSSPEALEHDLARMMRAIDLPLFAFTRAKAFGDGIACGNVLTGVEPNTAQPARDEKRGLWLMLDGEIPAAPELRVALAKRGITPAIEDDDAHLALAMYVAHGKSFFEKLNGQWNLVLHDPNERYTLLVTDRHGSRLLYYAEDGSRLVFSSEAKGVIAGRNIASKPGGIGFYQLLLGGAHTGDRTWLDGIRVMSPGTLVELRKEGRRRYRYHRLHFREGPPESSEDAYAEGFARRLRAATERCMRKKPDHPIAITLSGGLDSRSVALAIDRSHLPLTAITYGAPDSPDVIYARQLAQVIGLEHVYIEDLWPGLVEESSKICEELLGPSPSGKRGFYSAQLERSLWRSEGMAALNGVASSIWHPLYKKLMRVMLNGAVGDAMTGSHLTPNLLLGPSRAELIADQRRRTLFQDPELVAKILNPTYLAGIRGELEPYFAATFADIDQDEPLAISNVWDMENRQRRGTFSSFTIERYFCTCRSPYLDYELIDHLRSVPGRWRFQQRIYKRMLVTAFPEAAHVPWAYTRGRITKSPAYEFVREAFNFGKSRLKAALPLTSKNAHWNFRDDVAMLREDKDLAFAIERWTRSELFPSDLLDRQGVMAVLDMFARGERASELSTVFAHLVAFAKCSELFLASRDVVMPPAADPARFGVAVGP